jgi:hypothetical protein
MKQLDLILSIVAIVVGLVVAFVIVGTRRSPGQAPQVKRINIAPVQPPDVPITYAQGLPGGSNKGGGGRGGGGGKRGGFVGA